MNTNVQALEKCNLNFKSTESTIRDLILFKSLMNHMVLRQQVIFNGSVAGAKIPEIFQL